MSFNSTEAAKEWWRREACAHPDCVCSNGHHLKSIMDLVQRAFDAGKGAGRQEGLTEAVTVTKRYACADYHTKPADERQRVVVRMIADHLAKLADEPKGEMRSRPTHWMCMCGYTNLPSATSCTVCPRAKP